MSRGPGQIEQRIGELFAETRDSALSVADICSHAFGLSGAVATRAQRLSATRAAHRLLRRVRDADSKSDDLVRQAHENTEAALGRKKAGHDDTEYDTRLKTDPAWQAAQNLHAFCLRIGFWTRVFPDEEKRGWLRIERDHWRTTIIENGRLYFHPPDVPVRVWAVSIQPAGVIWAVAEVIKVTKRNVMVRYAGERARLDRRELWRWWAWWRGVMFASIRTGRIAQQLDAMWQERYGHANGSVPPVMQMPLAEAISLLGVPGNYTREDVIAAFRREVKKAHPDHGGTAEMFCKLVEARDRLLAAIGTSASPPKMPAYYASGTRVVYRSERRRSQLRLGHTRRLSHTRRLTG